MNQSIFLEHLSEEINKKYKCYEDKKDEIKHQRTKEANNLRV